MSSSDNIQALSTQFQSLRNVQGHYMGGDFNEQVDAPNGAKHNAMKALGERFGAPATPATEVLSHLGKPDELTPTLPHELTSQHVATMPGPAVPGSESAEALQKPYYLVYYWRSKHDYLWFKVDPVKETVINSDWYQALD
ncbi:hypothetical protein K450DRAFT_219667 [Umbelopsis ramanniana AG]|uniref:Uncharacterized protein n=1 Tax=Umbelopsis ramanniana AG TaxID=1314678 RepID=A0AAD5EL61_UMBRA|nr:uncharacterized protein K450DRAFT_219667 [Umbelopsis ramanniana AG]KAI8584395.1 hypothetical protein K450DRAFT_219667 [Umbelopsis ramanniana AG]